MNIKKNETFIAKRFKKNIRGGIMDLSKHKACELNLFSLFKLHIFLVSFMKTKTLFYSKLDIFIISTQK